MAHIFPSGADRYRIAYRAQYRRSGEGRLSKSITGPLDCSTLTPRGTDEGADQDVHAWYATQLAACSPPVVRGVQAAYVSSISLRARQGEEDADRCATAGQNGKEGEEDEAEEMGVLIGEVSGGDRDMGGDRGGGEGGGDDHDDGSEPEGVSEAANVEQGGHLSSFGRRGGSLESTRSPGART